MDILNTILQFVQTLSWPITVLIIVIIYHKPLTALINRIQSLKVPGGIEIQAEIMKKTQEKIVNIKPPLTDSLKIQDSNNTQSIFSPSTNSSDSSSSSSPTVSSDPNNIDLSITSQERIISQVSENLYSLQSQDLSPEDSVKYLSYELTSKTLQLQFEKIYNNMFDAQVQLLELLSSRNKMSYLELEQYYAQMQIKYITFKSWTIQNFLQYLLHFELIESKKSEISITPKGMGFLQYINNSEYTNPVSV